MTEFETIVRPFARKDVTPPQRIVGKEKVVEPEFVEFGGGGGFVWPYHMWNSVEFETEDSITQREVKRETYKTRVENPDDSSQFVEVDQVKKLWTRNKVNPEERQILELKEMQQKHTSNP